MVKQCQSISSRNSLAKDRGDKKY